MDSIISRFQSLRQQIQVAKEKAYAFTQSIGTIDDIDLNHRDNKQIPLSLPLATSEENRGHSYVDSSLSQPIDDTVNLKTSSERLGDAVAGIRAGFRQPTTMAINNTELTSEANCAKVNLTNKDESHESKFIQDQKDIIASKFFPSYVRYVSRGINQLHKISTYLSAKITLKMLSIAMRRRLSKDDRNFYNQGMKETYTVSKHRFHTYTYGYGGPVLLLLHGFCSNAARWRNYVQPLIEAGYQIVAMDAPGHGTSPGYFMSVPTYINCVKEVLRSRTQWDGIVAHSMGGVVSAVALGELNLQQLNKYVLLNSFNTGDSMMSTFARRLGVNEEVITSLRTRVEQNTGRPLDHYNLELHLSKFDLHGLIIHDKDDIIVPKSEAQKNIVHFSQFMTLNTAGLGHNLFSKEVEKTVINFLNKRIGQQARGPFPCKWEKYL